MVTGYADQQTSLLDPEAIVRKLVAGPLREPDWEDRALLERFWFDSTAQFAPVQMLSGGERRRLQLVMVLATKPNLLVLDEPTNDLDLDTLRALEDFLDDWPGALVVASHDRTFLDRTVDHVLAIDPGGDLRGSPGGVQGWLAERAPTPAIGTGAITVDPTSPTKPVDRRPTSPRQARATSQYTLGRQMRETEQAMAKLERQVDAVARRACRDDDHERAGRPRGRAGDRAGRAHRAGGALARTRRGAVGLTGCGTFGHE